MRQSAHVSPASLVTGCTVSATKGSTRLSGNAPEVRRTSAPLAPGGAVPGPERSTSGSWYRSEHSEYEYECAFPPHPFSRSVQKLQTLHCGFSWHARQHAPCEEVRNAPPSSTSPSMSAFSSALHGVTGSSAAGDGTAKSAPAPQYGIAGGAAAGKEKRGESSAPSGGAERDVSLLRLQEAMTLFSPAPTRKHPGHRRTGSPLANPTRSPSLAMTTSRSSQGTKSDSGSAASASAPQQRCAGDGSATRIPKQVTSKSSGSKPPGAPSSLFTSYRSGTAMPVISMVAHVLCPTTPVATDVEASACSGVTEWNVMSARAGHAANARCAFGFQPSLNVGASSASSEAGLSSASTSQYGASSVTASSMGIALRSLNENRKLEYPPTRNSPRRSVASPKVTFGPISSMSSASSEQGTPRCAASEPFRDAGMSCAPQHMNTNREGSAISVRATSSPSPFGNATSGALRATRRENSNATVTPRRLTSFSGFKRSASEVSSRVTTSETYISRAVLSVSAPSASTAPTRTRSSEGRLVHVVTENLSAPAARSGHPSPSRACNKRLGALVCVPESSRFARVLENRGGSGDGAAVRPRSSYRRCVARGAGVQSRGSGAAGEASRRGGSNAPACVAGGRARVSARGSNANRRGSRAGNEKATTARRLGLSARPRA